MTKNSIKQAVYSMLIVVTLSACRLTRTTLISPVTSTPLNQQAIVTPTNTSGQTSRQDTQEDDLGIVPTSEASLGERPDETQQMDEESLLGDPGEPEHQEVEVAPTELFSSSSFAVSMQIPIGYHTSQDGDDGSAVIEWDDGRLFMTGIAGPDTAWQACVDQANHPLLPYGSNPSIKEVAVPTGQPACVVSSNRDDVPVHETAIIAYPASPVFNGTPLDYVMIETQGFSILPVLESLRFEPVPNVNPIPPPQSEGNAQIYVIAPSDNGQSGNLVGCGDSVVPIVTTRTLPDIATQRIETSLDALFTLSGQKLGQSGLVNALDPADLQVNSVTLDNGLARVELEGTLELSGVCDNTRMEAQILWTVFQYDDFKRAFITLNGKNMKQMFNMSGLVQSDEPYTRRDIVYGVPSIPTPSPQPAQNDSDGRPQILTFTANKTEVEAGDKLVLTWETTGSSVTIRTIYGGRYGAWYDDLVGSGAIEVQIPDHYQDNVTFQLVVTHNDYEIVQQLTVNIP